MTEEEYLSERLEDQLIWYDKKSGVNQKYHKRIQLIEIVFAAVIPFVALLDGVVPGNEKVVALLGIVIAICAGLAASNKYQENWIAYRTTAESLKHEKYLYLTKNRPYDGGDAFANLVERVEGLISKENSQWSISTKKTDHEKQS